jgi:putative membrane protein
MSKNNKSLAMAATLTGLLVAGPALIAQSTSGSSGGGAMDSHPGAMQSSSSSMSKTTTTTMSKLSAGDTKFMKTAAMGGMEEVELGQLAAQKASSPEVKNFGQHMVDDHSKANDQLKQLAAQKGVTLPTSISKMQKHDMDKLAKLSGAAFDSAYVSMMVKDHKKDVADFQKESKSGKDSDVKSWASTTLPTLEDHLKMVQGISSSMHPSKSAKK